MTKHRGVTIERIASISVWRVKLGGHTFDEDTRTEAKELIDSILDKDGETSTASKA